jgi:hypothetical protein
MYICNCILIPTQHHWSLDILICQRSAINVVAFQSDSTSKMATRPLIWPQKLHSKTPDFTETFLWGTYVFHKSSCQLYCCCLSFNVRLLTTSLVSSNFSYLSLFKLILRKTHSISDMDLQIYGSSHVTIQLAWAFMKDIGSP